MPKFRTLFVEIEAVRNDGTWPPIIQWLDELAHGGKFRIPFGSTPPVIRNSDGTLSINTLESTMRADVGDWLIRDVEGEFYPCKPDVFSATYEAVDDSLNTYGPAA